MENLITLWVSRCDLDLWRDDVAIRAEDGRLSVLIMTREGFMNNIDSFQILSRMINTDIRMAMWSTLSPPNWISCLRRVDAMNIIAIIVGTFTLIMVFEAINIGMVYGVCLCTGSRKTNLFWKLVHWGFVIGTKVWKWTVSVIQGSRYCHVMTTCDDIDCRHVGGSRVVLPENARDWFLLCSASSIYCLLREIVF